MRDDREWLQDILRATERIEQYSSQGREAFDRQELIQVWMIYHLQIIGEASRALSPEIRQQYPEVPWSKIIGLRNILIHEHFRIKLQVVWSIVEGQLPDLKLAS
ncbi:HepT-like ribonuclease domain-containing protein [Kamptonema formosum]|uniref:HepT-like ribonuclease domain-containing protein n=1 Tax=Kamptonema formosum TaxID=331992 RepID=UPI00034CEB52|nr:HepT-like ribonuclease domain-containing protein [Oscillatoria sp. PCC 10802]